jgi:hypothetical protein
MKNTIRKSFALIMLTVAAVALPGYSQETTTTTETTTVYPADTIVVVSPVPVAPKKEWRTRLYMGVKAGANYSNVYDAEGEDFEADSKFGLAAGVFVSIPLGKYFGIQPEVLFSQRGFHATGTLFGSNYDITRTLNYIDVPLLVALKAGTGLTIVAGPQFSYLVKKTDKFNSENSTESILQEYEFKNDNITKNMMCFVGGLDFNFDNFVLGTRVGWDIRDNNGDGTATTPRYKNAWVQATLGLRF